MLAGTGLTTAATALTSILYSGQWTMKSGQQYLRARFYDPASGTFNRLDPFAGNLADPQSLHKYLYSHANPVMGVDPTGLFFDYAIGVFNRLYFTGVYHQIAYYTTLTGLGLFVAGAALGGIEEAFGLQPATLFGYELSDLMIGVGISLATLGVLAYHAFPHPSSINAPPITNGGGSTFAPPTTPITNSGRLLPAPATTPITASGGGRVFYATPQGQVIVAPPGYQAVTAQNGKGLILLPQGQQLGNNSNIIRWSEPSTRYPNGNYRYYNSSGQPLVPSTGNPGSNADTHFEPDYQGPLINYPGQR